MFVDVKLFPNAFPIAIAHPGFEFWPVAVDIMDTDVDDTFKDHKTALHVVCASGAGVRARYHIARHEEVITWEGLGFSGDVGRAEVNVACDVRCPGEKCAF